MTKIGNMPKNFFMRFSLLDNRSAEIKIKLSPSYSPFEVEKFYLNETQMSYKINWNYDFDPLKTNSTKMGEALYYYLDYENRNDFSEIEETEYVKINDLYLKHFIIPGEKLKNKKGRL